MAGAFYRRAFLRSFKFRRWMASLPYLTGAPSSMTWASDLTAVLNISIMTSTPPTLTIQHPSLRARAGHAPCLFFFPSIPTPLLDTSKRFFFFFFIILFVLYLQCMHADGR